MSAGDTASTIAIVAPDDKRLARQALVDSAAWFEDHMDDDPIYIVVTPAATDEQLASLGRRFGVRADELISFRDGQRGAIDPHQVVPTNPRSTAEEHSKWFAFFNATRRPFRVQGGGMSPRYEANMLIWGIPLDRPLEQEMDVIVELRTGECILGEINAADAAQVEIVNCWRGNRVGIPRDEIEAIKVVMGRVFGDEGYNHITHEPRHVITPGCWVQTDIPNWLWDRQRGLPFLAPDRSRDPWSMAEAA